MNGKRCTGPSLNHHQFIFYICNYIKQYVLQWLTVLMKSDLGWTDFFFDTIAVNKHNRKSFSGLPWSVFGPQNKVKMDAVK